MVKFKERNNLDYWCILMKWLLLFLYLIFILIVIFLERKRPTEALLWVLILICLPYVGIVLYLIFGSTMAIKLTSHFRHKRLSKCKNDRINKPTNDVIDFPASEEDMQVAYFNYRYNNARLTSYNSYDFYLDGKSHYEKLFEDINNATECIYVEFYTIHHDEVGEEFIKLLTKKANEGLEVLVMIDFIANISDPPKMFKELKRAGGRLIRIKPFLTHFRSHRKIVVIDHEISYIGGMNIGRKYVNMSKKKNPWRDTQIRLVGPCSTILDEYFLADWLASIRRKYWDETVSYVDNLPRIENKMNDNLCQFVVGGVDTNKESIKMTYLAMIRSARNKILIQTPYFVPDPSILDALKTAVASGVEVVLTIAGVKSSFFLDPVTTYYVGNLMEYGAKVYKYNGYIHAKTIIIDNELCAIGSVNMDQRSFTIDDEICGIFFNNEIVESYNNIYLNDLANSKEYLYSEYLKRGTKEKALEAIFLLFASIM